MKAYEEHYERCPRLKDVRADCLCPTQAPPYVPPQEMTSLTQIKAKLDKLIDICQQTQDEQVGFAGRVSSVEQSQSKLLAALNGPTAMNPCGLTLYERLNALDGRLKGLGDGLGSEIGKLHNDLELVISMLGQCPSGKSLDDLRKEMRYLTGNVGSLSIIMDRRLKARPAKPKRKRTK